MFNLILNLHLQRLVILQEIYCKVLLSALGEALKFPSVSQNLNATSLLPVSLESSISILLVFENCCTLWPHS